MTSPIAIKNKILMTLTCYLCYFYTAAVILVTGAVMKPLSDFFHNSDIGFAFTFINISMWLAIFVIGFLMNRFSIKTLLFSAVVIGVLSAFLCFLYPSMLTLKILLSCVGITGGLFMAIASYMIVHIYNDHKIRAMNVIFTDFFFSFGGAIIPIFAAYLITRNFEWNAIYIIIQVVAIAIFILVSFTDYSSFKPSVSLNKKLKNLSFSSWNFSLYCIAVSAFLFLLAQLTMTSYAQTYFQDIMGLGPIDANKPLSYFWIAQCVGLFISPVITRYIPLRFILPSFMFIATIALSFILFGSNLNTILNAAIIFGIFNCFVYAGLLAYGTFQMQNPPPTLITTILLFGTTGTALSTTMGAFIKKFYGIVSVMHVVTALYVVALVLITIAVIYSKEQKFKNSST